MEFSLNYFNPDKNFPFFIQYGKHDDVLYMHSHKDFAELVIVLSGSATHVVNDERFPVSQGDIFVISNDTEHGYEDTNHFRLCNIMFKPERLFDLNSDIATVPGFHALFICEPFYSKTRHFSSRLRITSEDFIKTKMLTDSILSEYVARKEGWQTSIIATFIYLVTMLSRFYTQADIPDNSMIMSLAETVSYINTHYMEEISIQELAENASYSERHFLRLFKDAYNTSPREYIMTLRLSSACTMLTRSNNSIADIAVLNGFNNSNYFCRIFKTKFGMSPGQYRTIQQSQT